MQPVSSSRQAWLYLVLQRLEEPSRGAGAVDKHNAMELLVANQSQPCQDIGTRSLSQTNHRAVHLITDLTNSSCQLVQRRVVYKTPNTALEIRGNRRNIQVERYKRNLTAIGSCPLDRYELNFRL